MGPHDQKERLKTVYEEWLRGTQKAGLALNWLTAEGTPEAVVEERGRRADFIAIAQPRPEDDRLYRRAFRAALFHTDRPLLMVPPKSSASFGRRVAIAWRDDERAAKAVIPALRFLTRAERVFVLTGVRSGTPKPSLPRILLEHGIEAELHVLPIGPGPLGQDLLATAHRLGADLLVMGAYAHSPLVDLILGGVTQYVLAHADMPVLMRH